MKNARRWIIGDAHISHSALDKVRGWNSFDDLPDIINELVCEKDTIYWLGDMVFGLNKFLDLVVLFNRINCKNHKLVLGNHDKGLLMQKTGIFKSIDSSIVVDGCLLTHIPVHESCVDRWKMNIHAHLHDSTIDDTRYVCVSLERTGMKPILLNEIIKGNA